MSKRISSKLFTSKTKAASTTQLLPSQKGHVGYILLNNPTKLNALTLPMIDALNTILPLWQTNDSIKATVFQGAPNQKSKKPCFCAGGDVKAIYLNGMNQPGEHGIGSKSLETGNFFRREYQTNYYIASQHNSKPQISIWDGIVMGGGLGLSVHGQYRIATQNTLLAMPETQIGLFPDVGGMYWLPRLPNGIGYYMALTGYRCSFLDCCYANIATHYIPSEQIQEFLTELERICDKNEYSIEGLLGSFHKAVDYSEGFLYQNREEIKQAFYKKESYTEILNTLSSMNTDFSKQTLETLSKMSPTSCFVTFEGMKRGLNLKTIDQVLQMEYRMCQRFMKRNPTTDFYEGIRALLVEKDHDPKWNPNEAEHVTDSLVQEYFESLGENELVLRDSLGTIISKL